MPTNAPLWDVGSWDFFYWDYPLSPLNRLRDLTGLTTDEISDTILVQFIEDAWEHVRTHTGRRWLAGQDGYLSAGKAVLYYAAGNAYRRANFQDRAKAMDAEGNKLLTELGPLTSTVMIG